MPRGDTDALSAWPPWCETLHSAAPWLPRGTPGKEVFRRVRRSDDAAVEVRKPAVIYVADQLREESRATFSTTESFLFHDPVPSVWRGGYIAGTIWPSSLATASPLLWGYG